MQEFSEHRLFDLIGRIYHCVLFPDKWPDTVGAIKDDFGWHNAVLGAYSFLNNGTQFQVALGIPEEYQHYVGNPAYIPDVFELWGGRERIDAAPLEEPVLQSEMGYPETWRDNGYFKAFSIPQGIIDAVSVGLARDTSMIATLTGGRHVSLGPITEAELAGLRVLVPHLRHAVTIANLFDNLHAQTQMFSATLETSRAGIVLVDQNLTILHTNTLAQQILAGGNPIRTVHNRLTLREEFSQSALLASVSGEHGPNSKRGGGILTRRSDGSVLTVHTFPLKSQALRNHVGMRATAAVVLAVSPDTFDLNHETVAMLYDLTPAETRIVSLSLEGLSMREMAARIGIAASTVKTHLLRAYEKTGTHKRTELAALVNGISSPW
jgi:DNA-binding CsgD family transcriptional regulator/PAS domain-containing protein